MNDPFFVETEMLAGGGFVVRAKHKATSQAVFSISCTDQLIKDFAWERGISHGDAQSILIRESEKALPAPVRSLLSKPGKEAEN